MSNHFPTGVFAFSFLTDNLTEVEKRLKEAGIPYEGPQPSHLGITTLQFSDEAEYVIRINTRGLNSPGCSRLAGKL